MLEREPGEERLVTFSFDREPPAAPGDAPVLGRRREDHRRAYLDYEGDVSGGRGSVRIWDRGEVEWVAPAPGGLAFRLAGTRLRGGFRVAPAGARRKLERDSKVLIARESAP